MDLEQQTNNNTAQPQQNQIKQPFQNQLIDLNDQQQQVYQHLIGSNNGMIRPLSQNNLLTARSYSDLDNAKDNISDPNEDDDDQNINNNRLVLNFNEGGDRQEDVDELQDLMMQAATLSREQANKESSSEDEGDQGEEQQQQREYRQFRLDDVAGQQEQRFSLPGNYREQPQLHVGSSRGNADDLLQLYPPYNEPLAQLSTPPPPPVIGAVSSQTNLDPPLLFEDEFKTKKRHRDMCASDERNDNRDTVSQPISDSYIPLKRQKNIKESLFLQHPQSQSQFSRQQQQQQQLSYRSFDNLVRSSDNSPRDSPCIMPHRFRLGERLVRINTKSQTNLDQQDLLLQRNYRQDEESDEQRRRGNQIQQQQQQNEQEEQVNRVTAGAVGGGGQISPVAYFAGGLSDSNIQLQQLHAEQILLKKNASQDGYFGYVRSNEQNKSKQQELNDAIDQINAVNQQKMRQYQQDQLQQQQQQQAQQFYNSQEIQQLQMQQNYLQQQPPLQQSQSFQVPYPPLELHRFETAPPLQYYQPNNLVQQDLQEQSSFPVYQPFIQRFLSTSIQNDRLSLFKQQSMNLHLLQTKQQQVDEEMEDTKFDIEENNNGDEDIATRDGQCQQEAVFDEEQANTNNDDAIEVEQDFREIPEIIICPAEDTTTSQVDNNNNNNNNNNETLAQTTQPGDGEEGKDSGEEQLISTRGVANELATTHNVSASESDQLSSENKQRMVTNLTDSDQTTENKDDNNQNEEKFSTRLLRDPNETASDTTVTADNADPAKVLLTAPSIDGNQKDNLVNSEKLTKQSVNATNTLVTKVSSQPSIDCNQPPNEQGQISGNEKSHSLKKQQPHQLVSSIQKFQESGSQNQNQIRDNQVISAVPKNLVDNSLASTAEDLAQNDKIHSDCSKEALVTYLISLSQPSSFQIIQERFVHLSAKEILLVIEELKKEQRIKTIDLMIDRKAHHGHTNVRIDYYQNQRKEMKERQQDQEGERYDKNDGIQEKEKNESGEQQHGNEVEKQQENQAQDQRKQAEDHQNHHHHQHHHLHHHHHHHHQPQEETSIMLFNDDNLHSPIANQVSDIHMQFSYKDHKNSNDDAVISSILQQDNKNSSDAVIGSVPRKETEVSIPVGEVKTVENAEQERKSAQCNNNQNDDTGSQEDEDSELLLLAQKHEQLQQYHRQMQITYQFMLLHQLNKKEQKEHPREELGQQQTDENCQVDEPPLSKHIHA